MPFSNEILDNVGSSTLIYWPTSCAIKQHLSASVSGDEHKTLNCAWKVLWITWSESVNQNPIKVGTIAEMVEIFLNACLQTIARLWAIWQGFRLWHHCDIIMKENQSINERLLAITENLLMTFAPTDNVSDMVLRAIGESFNVLSWHKTSSIEQKFYSRLLVMKSDTIQWYLQSIPTH